MNTEITDLAAEASGLGAAELLEWAARRWPGKVAFATSLGAEDQVLTHMIATAKLAIPVFTLDTGRLPQETYDLIEAVRDRLGITIEMLFPDRADVEALLAQQGPNGFRSSVEARKACCRARKVLPLQRRLAGLSAWITGLRREQAPTRAELAVVQWDEANGLVKLNPLADWTVDQTWQYLRQHLVPYSVLHDRGYPSIGCGPCTRQVAPGEDIRAGRWWWEQPQQKECGLHVVDGKLVRTRKDDK